MKFFTTGIIGVVAVVVIAGFFLAGSPQQQRLRQIDDIRSSHLNTVRYAVTSYWQTNRVLPKDISVIEGTPMGGILPRDPQTGALYEYTNMGAKTFELCATFSIDTMDRQNQLGYTRPYDMGTIPDYMTHPAGRYCFQDSIDEKMYPPFQAASVTVSTTVSST